MVIQTFGDMLRQGVNTAGWVIGFIAALGLFLLVVGIIGLLAIHCGNIVYGTDTKKGEDDGKD